MKNFLPILALSFAGLVSCSCSKTTSNQKPPASSGSVSVVQSSPPTPLPNQVKGKGWTFEVNPNFSQEDLKEMSLENSTVEVLFVDGPNQRLLTIATEEFPGTTDDFVNLNVAQIVRHGINVNSASHTKLADQGAGLIDSSSDVLHIWVWLTVKNGVGFTFACGGVELTQASEIFATCEEMARSFEIK